MVLRQVELQDARLAVALIFLVDEQAGSPDITLWEFAAVFEDIPTAQHLVDVVPVRQHDLAAEVRIAVVDTPVLAHLAQRRVWVGDVVEVSRVVLLRGPRDARSLFGRIALRCLALCRGHSVVPIPSHSSWAARAHR